MGVCIGGLKIGQNAKIAIFNIKSPINNKIKAGLEVFSKQQTRTYQNTDFPRNSDVWSPFQEFILDFKFKFWDFCTQIQIFGPFKGISTT